MDEAQTTHLDLREYIAILRARKWSVITTIVLILGLAITLTYLRTPIYQAQSKVLLESVPTDPTFGTVPTVDLETQTELVSSVVIATLVKEDLGLPQPADQLLLRLSVQGVIETQVMEIAYSSSNPRTAQAVANSFADMYLEYRRGQALEDVQADQDAVQSRVEATSRQLAQVTLDLEEAEGPDEDTSLTAALETQRSVMIARLGVLQQQMDDLQAQRATSVRGGDVIAPATLPEAPVSPNLIVNVFVGLLLGAAAGIGLALLRERLDDRFKDRRDVERALGAPVLATVPRYQASKKRELGGIVTLSNPESLASEAYRTFRTNLQFLAVQRKISSILTTSAAAEEGKTVTTANLAVALAQAGRRVVVVSADLRRPTMERYFDLGNEEGLSSWLISEDRELWEFVQDPGIPNLRIIPSGPVPPNPAELLASPKLAHGIRLLEQNCDLVLVDSPPILAVADAAILANHVGGTVLVTDAGKTHRSAVIRAKEELERVGGVILGCVFNGFDAASAPYYYQTYYYASEKEPRQSGNGQGKLSKRLFGRGETKAPADTKD